LIGALGLCISGMMAADSSALSTYPPLRHTLGALSARASGEGTRITTYASLPLLILHHIFLVHPTQ